MSDETAAPAAEVSAAPRKKPAALGRGLQALLGETRREEPVALQPVSAAGGALVRTAPQLANGGLAVLAVASIENSP